jgi:FlaA1/EpsC-like NDP-sugar epimerase
MGASKRIAEMLIQNIGSGSRMKMAAVRFGNVLGSNGSVIPIFLKQIKDGGPITLTDRRIKRYFMTIPEAVRLVLQTGALAGSGEVFVLDMGEPVYIYDLACDLIRINGLVPEKDIPIVVTGLRKGEKLFEELRYDKETVNKTVHEGIFVTKLEDVDLDEFNARIENLRLAAFGEDAEATTEAVFGLVPRTYRDMAISEQLECKEFIEQGGKSKDGAVNNGDKAAKA